MLFFLKHNMCTYIVEDYYLPPHTGAVACGLLEGTVLQHVSFGEAIQTALKLMLRSRGMQQHMYMYMYITTHFM